MNKDIFKDHIINNFLDQVDIDRKFCGLDESPAILFFDNCSSHIDQELLQILAQHMILVITYPSHTSHVFQVLDLLLFGVLKINKKYISPSIYSEFFRHMSKAHAQLQYVRHFLGQVLNMLTKMD